jgi:serine protease inhibitor
MKIANALWLQSGFAINPAFMKLSEKFYHASVASLDFASSPPKAADMINAWVLQNTKGEIPAIISRPERNTRLILTDTVFFKGSLTSAVDRKETRPRSFHLPDGHSIETPMMAKTGDHLYCEAQDFQAIRLAYGNMQFVMYVFLPRNLTGLSQFMRSLDEPHWSKWIDRFAERRGTIILPRFELTYGVQLNAALKSLGMAIAFDPDKADFSQIHPPPPSLFISDAEHKTCIKLDEEGTQAAAATSIGISATMARSDTPPPFQMVVDHPFFCAIAESHSGALLFAGIVRNPTR